MSELVAQQLDVALDERHAVDLEHRFGDGPRVRVRAHPLSGGGNQANEVRRHPCARPGPRRARRADWRAGPSRLAPAPSEGQRAAPACVADSGDVRPMSGGLRRSSQRTQRTGKDRFAIGGGSGMRQGKRLTEAERTETTVRRRVRRGSRQPRPYGSSIANRHVPSGCRRMISIALPLISAVVPSGAVALADQSL